MPKAKLSSFPRNHWATAAVTATMRLSAPSPKINRPVAMMARRGLRAVTAAPRKQSRAKMKVARFTPIRSMRMPPMSTITTLGTL